MKAIYIAGPISGIKNYREKFQAREQALKEEGYEIILNPAKLPEGLPYEAYMPICYGMIDAAKEILLMQGWESSPGANRELGYATARGYKIRKEEEIWQG